MDVKFETLEAKGDKAIQSTKQQLQKTWQGFEDSVDAMATRLNTGRKEFEARAEAQLSSFQHTIERYQKAAAGAAVTQKENLTAAVERMQDKMQEAKDHFTDLGQATSNSWKAYREAPKNSREAFEDAYETTKWEIKSVRLTTGQRPGNSTNDRGVGPTKHSFLNQLLLNSATQTNLKTQHQGTENVGRTKQRPRDLFEHRRCRGRNSVARRQYHPRASYESTIESVKSEMN